MGLLDALLGNDSDGSGMLGGLPQSWQYQNPVDLTPAQKQMMAMVGTQDPQDAGFNPLPQSMSPSTIFANGTAPITGGNTFGLGGMQPQQPAAPPQQPAAPQQQPAAPQQAAWPPAASPIAGLNNPFGQVPPRAAPIVAASDDDDEPAPGAQASPIGVGNYQMPRIGSAADFAPNPAAIPANAQPAQGQLPTAPAPAPAASPSIGDHLLSGLQSFAASKGLLPALVNGIGGLATGQRTDPEGSAARQQSRVANVTARALISRGVDPQTAIAAVQPGNGEMLKELFKTAIAGGSHAQETDKDGNVWDVNRQTGQRTISLAAKDDKFTAIATKNPDGSETRQSFNTKTGEYSAPTTPTNARPAVDPDSTGSERMKQLQAADPNYARRVQAAVDGDIQLPTQGQAARSPAAARFTEDVLAVSGSTSASDFATKAATRKDYASGVASRVTKSINTTIGHFATLDDAIDKLGNHSWFPSVTNYLHDKVASNTDTDYQKAKATFETNKEAAIKELDFALSGGHSSVSGSAEIRDKFNRADSPETLHAAVTEAMSLLQKRLQSHAKGFSEGTKSQRDEQDFIYPENRASFNKLLGSKDTSTGSDVPGVNAAAPSAAPTAPSPGVYVWTPDKGLAPAQ